mgnify:CR=1 FL=1
MKQDRIVILDLGSRDSTATARAIRALGVYSEIYPHDLTLAQLRALDNVRGVILNGGPNRGGTGETVNVGSELLTCGLPVLAVDCPQVTGVPSLDTWPEDAGAMQETLRAFVFDVCGAEANWNMADFIEDQVEQVRAQVGDKKVLLALSGGVDSSVAAALLQRAVGDQLTCFFPVDPETRIEHLGLTPDKTRLLLHTVENNTYYVTLIDCKTGDTLQKLAVSDFEPEDDYVNITETADFVCIQQTQGRICVLTQNADGLYQLVLRSDYSPDDLYSPVYATVRAMAFDGKRLAIVNNDETVLANDDNRTKSYLAGTTEALITLDGAYFDNCGFTLTVFDQTGVAYSGAYVSSLESVNYLTGGTLNMDHLVLPYSITLSWQNGAT